MTYSERCDTTFHSKTHKKIKKEKLDMIACPSPAPHLLDNTNTKANTNANANTNTNKDANTNTHKKVRKKSLI